MAWQEILAVGGLDDIRFARELNKRYRARKSEFYKGMVVADCEDNGTRMRATELHADLLGKKKIAVDLHSHDDGVRIYLPDNGRGDGPGTEAKHD